MRKRPKQRARVPVIERAGDVTLHSRRRKAARSTKMEIKEAHASDSEKWRRGLEENGGGNGYPLSRKKDRLEVSENGEGNKRSEYESRKGEKRR